jgi:hypothetical protein
VQKAVDSMDCPPYSHLDLIYDEVAFHAVAPLLTDVAPNMNGSSSVQVLGLHHPLALFAVD